MRRTLGVICIIIGSTLQACGPTASTCDQQSCPSGCCTADGQCAAGDSVSACGTAAAMCGVCTLGQQCVLGACFAQASNTGGGSASSGGGSAATGGGSAANGGGSAANGGGSAVTGGGSASSGGGSAVSGGGGTAAAGGGTSSSGGGSSSVGGGSAVTGGGSASSGGGTASTGGGTSSSGGGTGAIDGGTPITLLPNQCSTLGLTGATQSQFCHATPRPFGLFTRNLTFVNGAWWALNDTGVYRSTDGATWANRGPVNDELDIAFDGTRYVLVGLKGVFTSTDLQTWVPTSTVQLKQVLYVGTRFIAIGADGGLYTSDDAFTWVRRTPNTFSAERTTVFHSQVVAVGHEFVNSTSQAAIRTSTDGLTWSAATLVCTITTTTPRGSFKDVATDGSTLSAVGRDTPTARFRFTSTDGLTWQQQQPLSTGVQQVARPGRWVAVNSAGTLTSTDGITWATTPLSTPAFFNIASSAQGWLALATDYSVYGSTDGVTWARRTSANTQASTNHRFAMANGLIVAGTAEGIFTSTNGLDWSLQILNAAGRPVFGNGLWLAPTTSIEHLLFSTDGTTWNRRASPYPPAFSLLAYGNGTWVGMPSAGAPSVSTDGATWMLTTATTAGSAYAFSFANGRFVRAGDSLMSSADGRTWSTYGSALHLHALIYARNRWVATPACDGMSTTAYTSTDGVTWATVTQAMCADALASDGPTIRALNRATGEVLTSTDGLSWSPQTWVGLGNATDLFFTGSRWLSGFGFGGILATP